MKCSKYYSNNTKDSSAMLYMCAVCRSKFPNHKILDNHIRYEHSKDEISLYQATLMPGVKEYLQVYGNKQ